MNPYLHESINVHRYMTYNSSTPFVSALSMLYFLIYAATSPPTKPAPSGVIAMIKVSVFKQSCYTSPRNQLTIHPFLGFLPDYLDTIHTLANQPKRINHGKHQSLILLK